MKNGTGKSELKCSGKHCRQTVDHGHGIQVVIKGTTYRMCTRCWERYCRDGKE